MFHCNPPQSPRRRIHRRQQAPAARPDLQRLLDRARAQQDHRRRRVRAEHRRATQGDQGHIQDRVGDPPARHHRHGRRPRRVHLPEPEHEPAHRRAEHEQAHQHALLRMEARAEDGDVLPPHPSQGRRDTVHGEPGDARRNERRQAAAGREQPPEESNIGLGGCFQAERRRQVRGATDERR